MSDFPALDTLSKVLRLCGNGKENNWSVRLADYFFIDCACCIFFRGLALGIIIGLWLMTTIVIIAIHTLIR